MTTTDPYNVLGVSPDADKDEIKKQYRALVKQYHPDIHPDDPEAAKKMSEINEAYELINSGDVYPDSYSSGASSMSTAPSGSFNRDGTTYYYRYGSFGDMDMEDIFNAFFGSGFFSGKSTGSAHKKRYYTDPEEELDHVESYLISGELSKAAAVLNRITERNGRWYYLAAKLTHENDNLPQAMKFAFHATLLEPDNKDYKLFSASLEREYSKLMRKVRMTRGLISAGTILLAVLFCAQIFRPLFYMM